MNSKMASFLGVKCVFGGSSMRCSDHDVCMFIVYSSTGGSDSSVSDGLPMHIIYAAEGLKIVSKLRFSIKSFKK